MNKEKDDELRVLRETLKDKTVGKLEPRKHNMKLRIFKSSLILLTFLTYAILIFPSEHTKIITCEGRRYHVMYQRPLLYQIFNIGDENLLGCEEIGK